VEEGSADARIRRRNDSARKFAVLSEIHTRRLRARARKLDQVRTDRSSSHERLRFSDESQGDRGRE
jgi:hypothetical protein